MARNPRTIDDEWALLVKEVRGCVPNTRKVNKILKMMNGCRWRNNPNWHFINHMRNLIKELMS